MDEPHHEPGVVPQHRHRSRRHGELERKGASPNRDRADFQPSQAPDLRGQLVDSPRERNGAGQDQLPVRGRRHPLLTPLEEPNLQGALDDGETLAEGGLADAERLGGSGEAPVTADGGHLSQLPDVQDHGMS